MTIPLPIRFGPATCTSLEAGGLREWLVADGLGGYAMGTVSGLRTRRYHGLLVVAEGSASRRHLGLVALDPTLVTPGGTLVPLAVNEWAEGTLAPRGHELLESFDLDDGLPRWRWRIGDVVLERELAFAHGTGTLGVVHRLVSGGPVRLELQALVTWRDVHGERGAWGPPPNWEEGFRLDGPGWDPRGDWWLGARAREEAARGLSDTEDLWCAGTFSAELDQPGDVLEVTASTATPAASARDIVGVARSRAHDLLVQAQARDEVDGRLVLAADSFITTAPDVVAGYPWFGSWSRDTMTSYEGLLLETGRHEEGRRLLEAYAATLSEGMLANTADTGQTEWNTVDATLWFLHAVDRHSARTGDDLLATLQPQVDDIVDAHVRGTRYGIGVDQDGLLRQGQDGQALTWMDARVDSTGITPRRGKPVEVNALWLRGLATARRARRAAGKPDEELARLEAAGTAAFQRRFPIAGGRLLDVVDPDNAALRPNALLAASLTDPSALVAASAALLTPLGLRSLDASDPAFRSQHRGGPAERDSAYHQGTVWPWLIGPWVDAALVAGLNPTADLRGLEGHLLEAGLGSVSETADGAAPHTPTGCPFQAWSVAELLRARRRLL